MPDSKYAIMTRIYSEYYRTCSPVYGVDANTVFSYTSRRDYDEYLDVFDSKNRAEYVRKQVYARGAREISTATKNRLKLDKESI